MGSIQDLERLLAKITLEHRDAARDAGRWDGRWRSCLRQLTLPPGSKLLLYGANSITLADRSRRLLTAIADEPPVNLADGGTIRDGFHPELDELRDISRNSRQYIAAIETRERAATGIQSLKVRFNNVFGYYIEISKANLQLAPACIRTQADAGQRRTLHHTRTERAGKQGSGCRRQDSDAGARTLSAISKSLAAGQAQRIKSAAERG